MTRDLKPYDSYLDSSLPWLGQIPSHWMVRRGKMLFRCVDVRSIAGSEELLTVSSEHGVIPRRTAKVTMFKAESYAGYKLCWPGDLVINSLWAWGRGLGVSKNHGIVSSAYGVYRLRDTNTVLPRFIHELVRSVPFNWELKVRSKGIWISRLQLTDETFLDAPFPIPPIEEQASIVRFIKHTDHQIKQHIRVKRKLIALLNEQKQVIIHQAVTRGLNPNVQLKSSGVGWLGDVPEHWDVVALRFRYSQCLGKMLDSKRVLGVHSLQYLRNTDVQWDRINTSDLPMMDIAPGEYERYTVRFGDLLVCEGGEVGRCAIWTSDHQTCGFQKAIHRLRPYSTNRDLPRFLYYILRAAAQIGAFIDGHESTIPHLTGDKLRSHRFQFPDLSEQVTIVAHLDMESATIDKAVESAQHEIELLLELRTRLISDVVTGKLDVREAAAQLADLSETEEPLGATEEDLEEAPEESDTEEVDA